MKKENFVETNEESKGTLEKMIDGHNAKPDAHPTMEQNFSTMVFDVHGNDFGAKPGEEKHISPKERQAWNRAADAAEKIGKAELYAGRAETAEENAESASESAQKAYCSAITERTDAEIAANNAAAAEERVLSYINGAKGIRDDVKGYADTAKGKADEAASESQSALSYANRASVASGDAARHANRAEDAAKKAEALTEKVRNKADAGVTVESMDALPENASVGVVCTVKERVATNGYKVTGKVSDLFLTGKQTDFSPDLEGMYAYAPQFTVPDSCVSHNTLSGNSIYVYNSSGKMISNMQYPYVDGYPSWISFETLGVDSVDDEITLYVGELSQPMELQPEEIIFEDVERAMYHNGESWVEIVTAKHLGDIDKALDAILALDEKLLGGDA